jgi:hypothetical protein
VTNPSVCSMTTLLVYKGNAIPRTIRRISSHDLSAYPLPPPYPSGTAGVPPALLRFMQEQARRPRSQGVGRGSLSRLLRPARPARGGESSGGHGMARNMGFA